MTHKLILLITLVWPMAAHASVMALPEENPSPRKDHSRICIEETSVRAVRCSKMESDKKMVKYKGFADDIRYFSNAGVDLKNWPKDQFDIDDYAKFMEPLLCKASFDQKPTIDAKLAKVTDQLAQLDKVRVTSSVILVDVPPSKAPPAKTPGKAVK